MSMLKKYWIFIIAILISIGAIIRINIVNPKSSIKSENKFQIEDPSLITKIFLADRNGNTITLKKLEKSWTVNDKFIVREEAIKTILSTARKIRINKPVSNAAFENVMKHMATTGVSAEFFAGEKMIKSYTIGSNTSDHLGTYMLLKESKRPFVTHIPSFNGFLSPRYGIQGNTLDITNWRSHVVFKLSKDSIKQIKYTDFIDNRNSYLLTTNPLELFNSEKELLPINTQKTLTLLNSFKSLSCEAFKKEKTKIKNSIQLEELVVNTDTLRTYSISDSNTRTKANNFTVSRKYATLNNGDLMLIQDYVFNKVLINISELTTKKRITSRR